MRSGLWIAFAALTLAAPLAWAQSHACGQPFAHADCLLECYNETPQPDPNEERQLRYSELESQHQLSGLASYYSAFFDGRKTANGEIYRNKEFSAAHLTLPLGCWVEVKSRATGKKLRLRVNDRGPYAKKFMLDLSRAAARFLGVDVAEDRHVDVRVIAMPGEEPLPEIQSGAAAASAAGVSVPEAGTAPLTTPGS